MPAVRLSVRPHSRRHLQATLLCASLALIYPAAHAQQAGGPMAETEAPMPTVTVTGSVEPGTGTEGSGSLGSRKATVFKGVESVRDIPQPVTVITRQLLDDRALLDLQEVLQNTPGVSVDYVDSERVTYFSRGYQIDALQIDGFTINQSGSAFVQPDTAVLDRVEVLRGASGMLRGSGNPSATVNMVRKRPTRTLQASVGATVGSWDRYRVEGDLSGPLNAAGTVRGRVVAVNDEKDFFQKTKHEDRKVLYGVIEADLGRDTTVTVSLQHTDLDANGAWGNLPANFDGSALNLPRELYLGADWNRWNRYNQQAFAEIEHRFANDWTIKASAAWTRLHLKENGFKQTYFVRPAGTTNPYLMNVTTAQYTGADSDQRNFNVTANGPFSLFGRTHQLVVGGESLRTDATDSWGQGNLYQLNNVDIRTWDPHTSYAERDVPMTGSAAPTFTRQKGAFATARLSITDPLTVMVGGRLSWWEYEAVKTPANNYKINREATPFASVVYDFTKNINGYVSYTEIFTPQNVKDANGNILDPIRGEDYEAGVKGEFFGGRLTASGSVFRINNVGRAIEDAASADPCLPYYTTGHCRIAGGKTRSEGFELELAGELLPGWQVMGGYTNTRTKYLVDTNASNVGQPLRSIDPRHQLRVFTTYRPQGALQGVTVGGGAQLQSDAYATASGLTTRQGGYTVYNAMLGYKFNERYALQVNVNNVFDKTYYKKFAPTGISNYYGDPRNVVVSLRATL